MRRRRLLGLLAPLGLAAACATGTRRIAVGAPEDERLEARVKSALLSADGVAAAALLVESRKGVVTLRGIVASQDERSRALEVARATSGVRRVVDRLTVRTP